MKLTRFAAGWMFGLFSLQIPFELVYVAGDDFDCTDGVEDEDWYVEYCSTTAPKLVKIADLLPNEPYTPHEVEELADTVFEGKTVVIGAMFTLDTYPMFVCPIDVDSSGKHSFMLPQYDVSGKETLQGASFETYEENKGAMPFRIRVEKTEASEL